MEVCRTTDLLKLVGHKRVNNNKINNSNNLVYSKYIGVEGPWFMVIPTRVDICDNLVLFVSSLCRIEMFRGRTSGETKHMNHFAKVCQNLHSQDHLYLF